MAEVAEDPWPQGEHVKIEMLCPQQIVLDLESYDLVKETMPENEDLCPNCRHCRERERGRFQYTCLCRERSSAQSCCGLRAAVFQCTGSYCS